MLSISLFLVLSLASATDMPVADTHAAARQKLRSGDYDGVVRTVDVPGLRGMALQKLGKWQAAADVYAKEKGAAAALELARIEKARGNKRKSAAAYWQLFGVPGTTAPFAGPGDASLSHFVLLVDEAVKALDELGYKDLATAIARRELSRTPHKKRATERKALARIWAYALAHKTPEAKKALYIQLGETPAGRALRGTRSLRRDKTTALLRARNLSAQHDNPLVFATLTPFAPKARDKSEAACEIRYLLGKAARKTRRYKSARKYLDAVAAKCAGEPAKKARYLAAQVASFQHSKNAHALYATFTKLYPNDSLTDDVLLFQAERYLRDGDEKNAQATYQRITTELPNGDMAGHAFFQYAWLLAKSGDVAGARLAFNSMAKTLATQKGAKAIVAHDQALYWRARLQAFPGLSPRKKTADADDFAAGIKALAALAKARPASYYGHLARLVVVDAGGASGIHLAKRSELEKHGRIGVPADVNFARALELEGQGFDEVAQLYLDEVVVEAGMAVPVALLYGRLGGLARAHQVMRFSGNARLRGRPTKASLTTWDIAFPKAHQDALFAAAEQAKLPPQLLMGLSREESAFDAQVISWAGAVGLCQLMPATAKEEAKRIRWPAPSTEDLRNPKKNAILGANHLARRMSLGHPLLAIAAYNAGPGNVRKWRKGWKKGSALDAWVEQIPVEQTRKYVKKVTGAWVVYTALDADLNELKFALTLP